jgi:hypothetical protein
MLGILDIIVPGILVSFSMRIDYIRSKIFENEKEKEETTIKKSAETRYYFSSSIISYGIGLLVAYIAVSATLHPQPALLWVCPTMIFGYLGSAFMKKETISMLYYNE